MLISVDSMLLSRCFFSDWVKSERASILKLTIVHSLFMDPPLFNYYTTQLLLSSDSYNYLHCLIYDLFRFQKSINKKKEGL